jgi:hypothetical protein
MNRRRGLRSAFVAEVAEAITTRRPVPGYRHHFRTILRISDGVLIRQVLIHSPTEDVDG